MAVSFGGSAQTNIASIVTKDVTEAVANENVSIAIIGDSMARSYCRGLQHQTRELESVDILCWVHPSSGLTRNDYYDWAEALNGNLTQTAPDAAIVSMGANDAQRLVLNRKILEFASPDWSSEYSSRVDAFIQTLQKSGTRVFWVGMPIARSARYSKRMRHLNEIYSESVKVHNALFLPLWELTQDKEGGFTNAMKDPGGRKRIARENDGIHFTRAGEHIVACHLIRNVFPEMGIDNMPATCGT
ncbi:MAG: DUF459 domain-containing protein [Rhodobacteraceae bacterium]|nr:DUF459 domain-containing protein [Paracoccaceae bacterium]